MFKDVDSRMDLPSLENGILDFWDEKKIFEETLKKSADKPIYSFYDGPPFATGTPHYGHIVASTMKDAVPRYWTMKGYRVPRVWGWDCHGLPIENIAEKELGITEKKQIEEIGVRKFNEVCASKVSGYVSEWRKVIRRLGRWADMDHAYKTMDLSYMESVWWVFKSLWDNGLIYESYRAMHICPRCETTLSQSEVAEGYKDVKDLSAIAKFELVDEPGTYILAWTTTPWTLIGNVALAVGADIDYVKIETEGINGEKSQKYILAEERLSDVLKEQKYKTLEKFKGTKLEGKKYQPLFSFYAFDQGLKNQKNGWQVRTADFVTVADGTGVVHIAPAFGEDDMNLGIKDNLPFVQHVGMNGVIKPEAGEFAGLHVKPIDDVQSTDVKIIQYLAHNNLLFAKEKFEHSYPHCWRCDTPLLNYATTSWFVAVEKVKAEALKEAKKINWSPKYIKEGRFGKWLEGARDWSISRQRYWASVIPIWRCDSCEETLVIGSVADLEKLSGETIVNLHKDHVDRITFKCTHCDGTMTRIPDVLDTWFDSGSMPYAQSHYPFENKEATEKTFPAEFIAEGVDQTRCWFYYLHILSTSIKHDVAYKNVIVNGIVLAEDGKKMSKRLNNYPDPMLMFDKYGADVLRQYLLSSPVMQAENINFSEKELAELQRGMFRMLWNSYSFFALYSNIDKWQPATNPSTGEAGLNVLDRWILSELNILVEEVNKYMESYELTKAARLFAPFIDNLSNWYIRRSRKRFWKSENDTDKNSAYTTLHEVLVTLAKLMAPFTPFVSEEIYKNLTGETSVHLAEYPRANKEKIDLDLSNEMIQTRKVVELGLSARATAKIKVRQPLQSVTYHGLRLNSELEEIVADEVNTKQVKYAKDNTSSVEIDTNITEELRLEGFAREIIRGIQSLRKELDFQIDDRITLEYKTDSAILAKTFDKFGQLIAHETLATSATTTDSSLGKEVRIDGEIISLEITVANSK